MIGLLQRKLVQPPLDVPFTLNRESSLAAGLQAWYPAIGSRGANRLFDFGGRGLNGDFKAAGEPAWAGDSHFGNSLYFDGANDYVDVPHVPCHTTPVTMLAWIKSASNNTLTRIIVVHDRSGTKLFSLGITISDKVFIQHYDGSEANAKSTTLVDDGKWYCVVGVLENNSLRKIYVDGVLEGTDVVAQNPLVGLDYTGIGYLDWGGVKLQFYRGNIGEAALWNRALSPAEIWQLWAPETRWSLYKVPGIPFGKAAGGGIPPHLFQSVLGAI